MNVERVARTIIGLKVDRRGWREYNRDYIGGFFSRSVETPARGSVV